MHAQYVRGMDITVKTDKNMNFNPNSTAN